MPKLYASFSKYIKASQSFDSWNKIKDHNIQSIMPRSTATGD